MITAPLNPAPQDDMLSKSIAQALGCIAPNWPLDQLIAVNPYWGWISLPASRAAAQLGALSGTRLTMPRSWFREQFHAARFGIEHLRAACRLAATSIDAEDVLLALDDHQLPIERLALVTDIFPQSDILAGMATREVVIHQISQHCAAFFDDGQALWTLDHEAGLYGSWLRHIAADHGLHWHRGRAWLLDRVNVLPRDPHDLIAAALASLGLPAAAHAAYLSALLLSMNGWAAWCAYRGWQARLEGGNDSSLVELLAMRLAWESLLYEDNAKTAEDSAWTHQWLGQSTTARQIETAQQIDWLLQLAIELAYQQPLCDALASSAQADNGCTAQGAKVQAVFCIDVRSEVFRRALEATGSGIQTYGFAGFFGLPIAYSPAGSALTRPQLPGLLAPAITVTEEPQSTSLGQALARQRRHALQWRERWSRLRTAASSGFSFVESCGLAYAPKLLASSLPSTGAATRWENTGLSAATNGLTPRLPMEIEQAGAGVQMAASILKAMSLTGNFAPLVLLIGHGSHTTNNPLAAGLDCGACGGQAGDVNARVLAHLLNGKAVRAGLRVQGIDVPDSTHFVPGLHNTTTDVARLFDLDAVPPALRGALQDAEDALHLAGQSARCERAASLGLNEVKLQPDVLAAKIAQRANDWSQVRPEWGLANNAAFIVAPRQRTRGLNLEGRSFLHDYDWRSDTDLSILTLIMTAPMLVTNWINMQYHASTVDNARYGSGNKVLHNVVGGHIGVLEGNGGDLRIGLPMQSLHDGHEWRHTPLRLSVFIEAPQESIDSIIDKHEVVSNLVANGWVHLFRIDDAGPAVERRWEGSWMPGSTPVNAPAT